MPVRYGYRRFGEDDDFDDLDVEEMLRMLADDFMENGDLEEAMDRLLREGYTTADGERIEGLRDLLEQARGQTPRTRTTGRPRRRDAALPRLARRDRGDRDTASSTTLLAEAEASDDERRKEVTRDLVDQKKMQRDLMSDRFGERLGNYQDYEFVSIEAREQFERAAGRARTRRARHVLREEQGDDGSTPTPKSWRACAT